MSDTTGVTRSRRFLRKPRPKKEKSPTGDMSLVEHLQELRRRVIISILALVGGTIIGFMWYQHGALGLPPLGEIVRGPYCSLPAERRADFSHDGECRLLATAPMEMFMLRLKVGALAGAVLSSPVWLYQIWAFIVPGLHKKEKRATFIFVTLAVLLFTAGAVLAYFVVHFGLEFLMGIGDEFQAAALTGERYYNFLLVLLLIFGVSFEVPLIIVMLNIVGVLHYETMKDKRRIIILVIFVFAAFMTPGQDPVSMVALAIALTLLVEMALQFVRWNDKRRAEDRPEWLDLDDEAASPLSTGPGGTDAPQPVAPAAPVNDPAPRASGPTATSLDQAARRPGTFDDVL